MIKPRYKFRPAAQVFLNGQQKRGINFEAATRVAACHISRGNGLNQLRHAATMAPDQHPAAFIWKRHTRLALNHVKHINVDTP